MKPKVLVLDIETAPMTAYLWNLKDQYVNLNQLKTDWYINAWGAKWFGAPVNQFEYADQSKANVKEEDREILEKLWKLIDQADYIVTQNGKLFDWPKIKARMMLNGLKPPSYFQHIDVYKELKEVGFTSHSLEYLTNKFCKKYRKLSHPKFAGLKLWIECDRGNIKAWNEMKIYNRHDVLATEELLVNTLQWLPKVKFKLTQPVSVCKKCGSKQFTSDGIRTTKINSYRRLYCRGCGELFKEVMQ